MSKWRRLFQKWRVKRFSHLAMVAFLGITVSAASLGATGCGTNDNTIVIAGKNFPEQDIMADVMKLLIEHDTNLHVKMYTWLDSSVTWNAMKQGKIDAYVEYTGTGLVNVLHEPPQSDPQKVYNLVKKQFEQKYHVTWLNPIGFNNTYAMVMTQSEASKLGIHTISQMAAKSDQFRLGAEQEFVTRQDTLKALQRVYHVNFKDVKTMDIGLKYVALANGQVDVADGYSTDGDIPHLHLVVLQDDKHVFPPYYACPVIRDSVLKAHPELKTVLNKLSGKISDAEMQKLNEQVVIEHKPAMEVAKAWLQQQGLIS
ncbi:ABC transporter substrate-binding protein [Alicyclobacillus dauci]|uniref:Glycine/betaine ABC transporter substrate-binding protein n=1 Tax=Alicyclobacillus dauci TaxID=1475485 RepID=A0ABY6Z0N8_9BACL|nr:glycine betaine ABC transporter substrate-binding protein [Alicyclobacillus dauci]WAH36294.1 glycine/betaine ABC transporter substrate-binding protein [Alicyclobacillus dauci]